jgi:hypothetical protein
MKVQLTFSLETSESEADESHVLIEKREKSFST